MILFYFIFFLKYNHFPETDHLMSCCSVLQAFPKCVRICLCICHFFTKVWRQRLPRAAEAKCGVFWRNSGFSHPDQSGERDGSVWPLPGGEYIKTPLLPHSKAQLDQRHSDARFQSPILVNGVTAPPGVERRLAHPPSFTQQRCLGPRLQPGGSQWQNSTLQSHPNPSTSRKSGNTCGGHYPHVLTVCDKINDF